MIKHLANRPEEGTKEMTNRHKVASAAGPTWFPMSNPWFDLVLVEHPSGENYQPATCTQLPKLAVVILETSLTPPKLLGTQRSARNISGNAKTYRMQTSE